MNTLKKYEYKLEGLHCANCANKIQTKVAENKDYQNVSVNFNTLKLSFETDVEVMDENIISIVKAIESEVKVINLKKRTVEHNHEHNHSACGCGDKHCHENEDKKSKIDLNIIRVIVGILVMAITLIFNMPDNIKLIFTIIAYVILLYRTGKNTIKLMKKGTFNENFLVTISCVGALLIGEDIEGLMVIVLYEIGKILEEKAINNTRKSIADLMDIRPEYANLKHGAHDHKVSPEEVNIGDIIVIKQGEKIPLDGRVISGEANLNTASLTGESILRNVKIDDMVLSGSINENGLIEVKVTEKYEDSTVNKILELVENATDKKAKTETFVSKTAKIYTPAVFILAILVALITPIIFKITQTDAIYRALIFLVVSCPCAIAISVPLSYFSGIGKASKSGILVKGSNFLDALKDIKYIAFDKTGTLTKGSFEVEKIKIYDTDYSEDEILEFAAIGESFSNHPLAVAILKKYGKTPNNDRVRKFKEVTGKGLEYILDEKTIKVGNAELTGGKEEKEIGTIIYVKVQENVIGSLVLNDTIKPEAKEAMEELDYLGIQKVMFTGDNFEIAKKVASEIGINEIKAEMLPTD